MMLLKFLRCFRFTFFVFALALLGLWGAAAAIAYQHLDSLVVNGTNENWRFGFTSVVRAQGKEVLFRGSDFPYPLSPGARLAMGHDGGRERILGVYVESGGFGKEFPCPQGFSFYRVEISGGTAGCEGTNGGVSRWLAALPVSRLLLKNILGDLRSLLLPDA